MWRGEVEWGWVRWVLAGHLFSVQLTRFTIFSTPKLPPFHLFSDIISRTDSPFTILPKDSPNIASLIIAYFGEHLEKSLNECVRPLSISAFLWKDPFDKKWNIFKTQRRAIRTSSSTVKIYPNTPQIFGFEYLFLQSEIDSTFTPPRQRYEKAKESMFVVWKEKEE